MCIAEELAGRETRRASVLSSTASLATASGWRRRPVALASGHYESITMTASIKTFLTLTEWYGIVAARAAWRASDPTGGVT